MSNAPRPEPLVLELRFPEGWPAAFLRPSSAQLASLRSFLDQARGIEESGMYDDMPAFALKNHDESVWPPELVTEVNYFGDHKLRSFLTYFRIAFGSESGSFRSAKNTLRKSLRRGEALTEVDSIRAILRDYGDAENRFRSSNLLLDSPRLANDDGQRSPEDLVKDFLYGRFLHADLDRLARIEASDAPEFQFFVFLDVLVKLGNIYMCFGRLVEQFLEKIEQLDQPVNSPDG